MLVGVGSDKHRFYTGYKLVSMNQLEQITKNSFSRQPSGFLRSDDPSLAVQELGMQEAKETY